MTLHRRQLDVISTSFARWESLWYKGTLSGEVILPFSVLSSFSMETQRAHNVEMRYENFALSLRRTDAITTPLRRHVSTGDQLLKEKWFPGSKFFPLRHDPIFDIFFLLGKQTEI